MEKILDNLVSEHEESVNTSIDKGTGSNFEVPNNREPPHSTNLSTRPDRDLPDTGTVAFHLSRTNLAYNLNCSVK